MHKIVKVEEAVGLVLAHDVTEIRPAEFKGRAFKKGHRIETADICHLRRLGKQHIYVLNIERGYLHENDAAIDMADSFCGTNVEPQGEPAEGKVRLVARVDGLLTVAVDTLTDINMLGEVMCASRHTYTVVKTGETVAATRAIPLVVSEEIVNQAVSMARATSRAVWAESGPENSCVVRRSSTSYCASMAVPSQ